MCVCTSVLPGSSIFVFLYFLIATLFFLHYTIIEIYYTIVVQYTHVLDLFILIINFSISGLK